MTAWQRIGDHLTSDVTTWQRIGGLCSLLPDRFGWFGREAPQNLLVKIQWAISRHRIAVDAASNTIMTHRDRRTHCAEEDCLGRRAGATEGQSRSSAAPAEQADWRQVVELRLEREAREHARLARKRNDLEAETEHIEALAAAEQRKPQADSCSAGCSALLPP